jgi:hypothetical protein
VSEPATQTRSTRVAKAANLFDLRRIIGGVFIVYGLLLVILGAFDSEQEIDKAAGVNINLWAGLGMLAFGLLMVAWALLRPLSEELGTSEEASGPVDAPPPRGVDAAALGSHQRRGRPGSHDERPVGPDDARPE